MRIELAFSHYQHFQVEPLRISQLLEPNSTVATVMGIRDRLTEYFRTEKKAVALALLHELISNAQVLNENLECVVFPYALTAFRTLASFAERGYEDRFHTEFNSDEKKIIFRIEHAIVKTLDFSDALDGIAVNGKHFLNNYDAILSAHAALRTRLFRHAPECASDEERACETESARYFYRTHPQLKTLLLQCHAQDGDMLRDIFDVLAARGRIQRDKPGCARADVMAQHLHL